MDILVNVANQKLKIATNLKSLIAGTQEFVRFTFNLTGDWDDLLTFAQFQQNGVAYNAYLDENNSAYLPSEIGVGTCTLMLYGSNDKTIATTNYLTLTIDENILVSDANSTEISESLYTQLVTKVNTLLTWNEQNAADLQAVDKDLQIQINKKAAQTDLDKEIARAKAAEKANADAIALKASQKEVDELSIKVTQLESNEVIASLIEAAVVKEMEEYLAAGTLANLTIADGSITRSKVNSELNDILTLAETAMQPSVYDKLGRKVDVFDYAQSRADTVQNNLNTVKEEIKDAYVLTDDVYYTNLGDALRGAITLSRNYAQALLSDYKAFTIEFVDELPLVGESMIFYLIPKESGEGYDKYWWIVDDNGDAKWDMFGGTSTLVVTELPAEGEEDIDYILKSSSGCLYYKWIDGYWEVVAGSIASVVTELPETGNEFTDYYLLNESGSYVHHRYINGRFHTIGSDSYTKDEIDEKLAELSDKILALNTTIDEQNNNIDLIEAKVDALGNLVSDVTESDSGIKVYYQDGSSKTVDTKDTTVKVEDVNKSESGLSIVYTDGSTKELEISGGGGTSTSGSASITRITASSTQCVYGDECPISFTFNALDSAGDMVGDGTATWYVGNIRKATSIVHQGDNTFDIGDYLSVGTNNVKVSISVDTGGDTPTVTTKTWSVNAINMYAVWDYDDTTINISDTVAIRWTPYGDLSKTTHILIDGEEVITAETTRSGVQQYATINKYSHGSHMVELYLTATVNGTQITSESIFHDMIFVDTDNTTPVIASPIANAEMTQYNTLQIPVVIYNPKSLTANAVLAVDGVEVASWEDVDRTVHYWNYTPNDFGTKTLTITCGETIKTITIVVSELDIDNEEISGYAFRLKASDIAGNEALRAWNSNGVGITFSDNFDWNNGGIKTEIDESGNVRQFICVKAGTTATINYELFGNEAKTNGKNFKVIFKVMNSRDYDAKFLSCMDSGIGIELGANGGTASSSQNTLDIQYAEGSYTEFEYDIAPDSSYRYIQTYLDGVLTSTNVYATDDNFTHTNKQMITIGSEDCDVYIYMVKAYEVYLTRDNHIENFIADAPNAQEMVARYDRNNVLTDAGNEISYEKLAAQNPKCRVHLWDIPRMTEGKKDYVTGCSYQQIYNAGDARHQLTASNVTINIQGTSSVDYKDSGANTDGEFTEGFTDGNGEHIDTYSMSDNSIGVNYFNTKVNIASCENINNMCIAEWYHRYQPYMTAYRLKNPNSRDCMEHNIGVQFIKDQSHGLFADDNYHMYAICNMGNSKNNSAVFHDLDNPLECCIETKDNNSTHCMMLDPAFDVATLDSEDYFEFRYPKSPTDDMKNAFVRLVRWFANGNPAAHTDAALETSVTFEPYTFKGTGQEGEVLAGLTIDKYAGTYTHDTYEYRMAKMLSECEDYLIMDAMVYHYVFIEQHAMVDNVCKNTFWGTEDLVHWHLVKNYDNDTADGNNNTGKLVIPFGSEGFDDLGDGAVFNGRDNVYWCFIYGLYEARQLMWTNRETAGAWNAEAYLAFAKERQNIIPERVYNQDYWYKYLRLYEQKEVTTYIPMLEGGKKNHQREAFVTNNLYYMASQYMGTACTSKSITLRGYTPNEWAGVEPKAELQVMLYNKGYIVTQIGSIFQRVKAEKGQYYTIVFSESGDMNDTVINIHGANMVQAVGDISCLYVGRSDFSAATKLRSLQIGSTAEGYSNNNLTEIGFGTNTMLEYLYIQNCPNIAQTLDLSGCQALLELDIRGSGFTGVTFAVGGLLEKAQLCSPASLNMRNLYNLTDENFTLESYDNLSSIRLEECPGIDTLALVNYATNLTRLRMLGIDWELAETTLLNRLLKLMGLDESDHNLDVSVLTGEVYISGQIREQELTNYDNAWENLEVTYDATQLVQQYLVTYVNSDDKMTVLFTMYVDRGAAPPDPYAEGYIEKPTKESDAQYTYSFGTETDGVYDVGSGWDDLESVILAPKTITAVYTESVRKYTVTWYSRAGLSLGSVEADYGSEVVYSGETPINTSEEGVYIYNVFAGWNKSTGYITEDTDVYAIWERAELPAVGKSLEDMTVGEIFAITTSGNAANYFEDKDHYDITLGHDFDFENVESEVIAENLYLDGSTAQNTGIKLFDANERSFTLAIDFRFTDKTNANNTLLSCFEEDGAEGFRLCYNSSPTIQWGDKSQAVGYQGYRDIVVLRHIKGENKLYVYASNNTNDFSNAITRVELTRNRTTQSDNTLTLGAVRFVEDGGYDYYGSGYIYWAKIWYDDLGETNAQALASWSHEVMRVEYCGAERYRLVGGGSQSCNASFIANTLLVDRLRQMNPAPATNVGGWDACAMRTFLNNRMPPAMPTAWRSMLKQVKIQASEGNKSSTILISNDYFYLPCLREMGGSTDVPYSSEGSAISWFTSDIRRAKFRGLIIPDDATYYTNASDPSTTSTNDVRPGDVWKVNNSGRCHIYATDELIREYGLSTTDSVDCSLGGKWISAYYWWERSPNVGSTTSFWNVSYNGNSYNSNANYSYGVCPCFSI